jgi:hypothetical protein
MATVRICMVWLTQELISEGHDTEASGDSENNTVPTETISHPFVFCNLSFTELYKYGSRANLYGPSDTRANFWRTQKVYEVTDI